MVPKLSTTLFNVCIALLCKARKLEKAKSIIIYGIRTREVGLTPDIISYNSLLACATRTCQIDRYLDLFDEMIQRGIAPDCHVFVPELVTYNILVSGLCMISRLGLTRRILKKIGNRAILSNLPCSLLKF
ncbi:hypothetical protein GQ457_01G049100 [Hibiscus cannabinus]